MLMTFLDTNILLYAISSAPDEEEKRNTARAILRKDQLVVSVQVLQEFYVQATRSSRPDPLSHEEASALISNWLRFQVVPLTVTVLQNAINLKSLHPISYWDAAIVSAASAAGCPVLFSEDLKHGQDYGGVQVSNPFFGSTF
jgi:predicted nucleic acid-binding protein